MPIVRYLTPTPHPLNEFNCLLFVLLFNGTMGRNFRHHVTLIRRVDWIDKGR